MKKSFRRKLLLIATIIASVAWVDSAKACVEGEVASRDLQRNYAGITSLPIARYMHLDDSCNGRRLTKVTLWASSSAGPGLATLIVNGSPVGPSQAIGPELAGYEFPLDPDYNHLGSEVWSMEIRLSGTFYVDRVEGSLDVDTGNNPAPDYWTENSTFFASTPLVDSKLHKTFVDMSENPQQGFTRIVFVAREADFSLAYVRVNFADRTHRIYGPGEITKNQAAKINIGSDQVVVSMVIVGNARWAKTMSRLEVRGMSD
jgi:hypothetical protein